MNIEKQRKKIERLWWQSPENCRKGYIFLGNPWAIGYKCNGCQYEEICLEEINEKGNNGKN
jgi:hypothetical protein